MGILYSIDVLNLLFACILGNMEPSIGVWIGVAVFVAFLLIMTLSFYCLSLAIRDGSDVRNRVLAMMAHIEADLVADTRRTCEFATRW